MKKHPFTALILAFSCMTSLAAWAATSDPLVGTWKTIDDRTGYSLSDVIIQKNKNNEYSAKIINVRSVPGAETLANCIKCTGPEKNQPLVGLTTLTGLTIDPHNAFEFNGGELLDPKSGQRYQARARLMSNGKHLIIHSSMEGSAVGRNITWVKN